MNQERMVEIAVDAALGEVARQAGELGTILKEARSAGIGAVSAYFNRVNEVDRARIDNGDYIRCAGDAICPGHGREACGYPLWKHPTVPGCEWLHRRCDGRLVKL